MRLGGRWIVVGLMWMCAAAAVPADSVDLGASQDTMILDEDEATSNGSGVYTCVGNNGLGWIERGLYLFDVSSIPAGSTVTDVALSLWVAPNSGGSASSVDLHLLLESWGEGSSDAPSGECAGTEAEDNDATWNYRFYDAGSGGGSPWSNLGGTFFSPASASQSVTNSAAEFTWSSSQMIADVQGWVNSGGATNFGWLLKKPLEDSSGNSLRFRSRQNSQISQRPKLSVTFTPPPAEGACCQLGATCSELTSTQCMTLGGTYQGGGTTCAMTTCVDPTGACCDPAGTCSSESQLDCQAAGAVYQGDDESCGMVDCPIVLEPFVDALPLPAVAQPTSGSAGATASYTIAMREVQQQLHRDLPPTTVWGYGDGPTGASFPGPTIEAGVHQPVTIDFVNDLRESDAPGSPLRVDHYLEVAGTEPPPACHIHGAQDKAKAVVHLHGGHVPAAVDGYPEDNYEPGNSLQFVYPNNQPPATIWYHDHALGITRLNVYMGLAGFYLIRDGFEQGLGLPSGEFEIPLAIQDRSFNPDGTLSYPADIQEVFFGDFVLVNGKVWPYLEVKQGKYRFRMLNGSGSRTYRMTLDRLGVPGDADLPFTQIGTDGGLLPAPLTFDELTLAPAERADVIIDFEALPIGSEVVLTNDAPAPFPGAEGIGVIPKVMKFVVSPGVGHVAAVPAALRPVESIPQSASIRTRDFRLRKVDDACGGIWLINDLKWDDITEYPQLGTTEIWRFINPSSVMHPMHMHLVFFQVLDRIPIGGGPAVPPAANELGWKDTVRADPGMITRVIARFEDYAGKYAYHCHILEHEDHEMMRQFWSVEAIDLSLTGGDITWSAQPGAVGYDVIRGDLGQLRSTAGDYGAAPVAVTCLANNTASTAVSSGGDPSAGAGYFYLTRAVEAEGAATYDSGSSSQSGLRDAEIAASGNDCP